MEQEIHFTNNEFDFTQLSISQPISVQGGAYFTKLKMKNDTLYIQLPKCVTKQGLNETNKKAYMDLMFNNDDEYVIEWFENLENKLVDLVYQKKDIWFQNEMEKEDIETFFNPICRPFKGGKFHLVRINIPRNKTLSSQYHCNVYDENENIIPIQDINDKHSIIPVLEIQGIKFSARNFQLELLGKQIMILNNKPLFKGCVIKRSNEENTVESKEPEKESELEETINNAVTDNIQSSLGDNSEKGLVSEETKSENSILQESILETLTDDDNDNDNAIDNVVDSKITEVIESSNDNVEQQDKESDIIEENLEEKANTSGSIDLEDITTQLSINNSESKIILKKPNEVYYEIYKIAKDKAKQHKKAAISHYLEAKKIKNTYLLDDLDNSDESSEEEDSDSEKVKNEINEIVEELL
tara:strand:+ start:573 stop:1811 length:1239 start_codon:yes stop_codon:yes gene_type:complete